MARLFCLVALHPILLLLVLQLLSAQRLHFLFLEDSKHFRNVEVWRRYFEVQLVKEARTLQEQRIALFASTGTHCGRYSSDFCSYSSKSGARGFTADGPAVRSAACLLCARLHTRLRARQCARLHARLRAWQAVCSAVCSAVYSAVCLAIPSSMPSAVCWRRQGLSSPSLAWDFDRYHLVSALAANKAVVVDVVD